VFPTGAAIALLFAAQTYLGLTWTSAGSLIPVGIIWLILLAGTSVVLRDFQHRGARRLPVATAGELARMVLTMNFADFAPATVGGQPPSREAVWAQIVHIFSDQMQIDAEEIVPGARISEDLRID
jgi:hypothetical protein